MRNRTLLETLKLAKEQKQKEIIYALWRERNPGTGANGREVELSTSGGFIVWRYVGDVAWINICPIPANGADGITPTIGVNGNWYIGATDTGISATGSVGGNGAAGRGIVSVTLTNTVGLVKTYTITFTDATTSIFQVTDGADGTGGGGGGTIDEIVEVYIDFVDSLPYTYTCPVALRFTTLEYEGASPTLSVALNTYMAQYQDITITPNGSGLVLLRGAIASTFSFDVYIDFAIAGAETYKCPYALKFTAMEHEQANVPTLSIALNTDTTKYQVQTVTADAPGLVTLKATIL